MAISTPMRNFLIREFGAVAVPAYCTMKQWMEFCTIGLANGDITSIPANGFIDACPSPLPDTSPPQYIVQELLQWAGAGTS